MNREELQLHLDFFRGRLFRLHFFGSWMTANVILLYPHSLLIAGIFAAIAVGLAATAAEVQKKAKDIRAQLAQ